MSQMQEDLSQRIGDKLRTWVEDSEELFEMGKLSRSEAHVIIVMQMMIGLGWCVASWTSETCDRDLVAALGELIRQARAARKQEKERRRP